MAVVPEMNLFLGSSQESSILRSALQRRTLPIICHAVSSQLFFLNSGLQYSHKLNYTTKQSGGISSSVDNNETS